jgi:serpin B
MTESRLSTWLGAVKEQEVEIFVPKWKFSFGSPLKQLLTSMGMKSAFIPGMADLSGINGDKTLYVSEVVHRAFVDVDETGTEAAAATGAIVKSLSLQVTPVFRADHPFIFLIRHAPTRTILFLGRVVQPTT